LRNLGKKKIKKKRGRGGWGEGPRGEGNPGRTGNFRFRKGERGG